VAGQDKPREDGSSPEHPAERYRRAVERVKETQQALDDAGSRAVETSRAAEAVEVPAARTRAKGMAKAATGNEAKLTPEERKAVAGSKTREGLPYFETTEQGKTRLTEGGRAELAKDHPEIGRLLDGGQSLDGPGVRASGKPDAEGAVPSRSSVDGGFDASRNAAPPGRRIPVTRADVHAAATAPDARRRLGDVRAGRLHALEAYRFFSEKLKKKGSLSPEEQVKFERAKRALTEAMEREGQMRRSTFGPDHGNLPPERRGTAESPSVAIAQPNTSRNPAQGEDIDDPEEGTYLSERHGKRLKRALELPQDASSKKKEEATQLILDQINRKSRYLNPRTMGGVPLMRGIKRPELFNTELTLTPEERLIVHAPHEIVAVFGPDGRLKKAVSNFQRQWSSIPELNGPGHVVTHQHPSGLPPSYMDLIWLIAHNPMQIHRTVARQKDGSMDLFEMQVTGQLSDAEIKAMGRTYMSTVGGLDGFESRILAIELTVEQSNGKLQFTHKRIQ
jgi:hypothetical protein